MHNRGKSTASYDWDRVNYVQIEIPEIHMLTKDLGPELIDLLFISDEGRPHWLD